MNSKYESISIQFRDVSDGVNQRKRSRTFTSRLFEKGNPAEELVAAKELWTLARKHGFTSKEVLKVARYSPASHCSTATTGTLGNNRVQPRPQP